MPGAKSIVTNMILDEKSEQVPCLPSNSFLTQMASSESSTGPIFLIVLAKYTGADNRVIV
jgi:hypothetical protein